MPRNSAGWIHTRTDKQRTDATQKRGYTCCCRPEELYEAQMRTMPCADGEMCHQQDKTTQAPHGHVCQGGCGGRLHGNCGSVFDNHEMAALLAGTHASSGCEEEDEEEDGGGDENTGRERRAPPAYDALSSHFGVLEAAAKESGNGDAAFYQKRAKMAMIAAHSAKRVRQAT